MRLTVFEGLHDRYRYRGYGDGSGAMSPAIAAGANAVMDSVISVMRGSISTVYGAAQASVYVSAVTQPGWLDVLLTPIVAAGAELISGAPQNRRDAYLSALNTMSNLADKLDGPDRQDVLAGKLALKKWLDAALTVQQGIFGILQDMGSDMQPAADLWNALQTSYNWVEQHKPELPSPWSPWTWIIGGTLLLGGVVVLGVWFAPEIRVGAATYRAARRRLTSGGSR